MRKFRILLVEDEDAVRFGFSRYLEREKFSVQEACCLTRARDLVSDQTFDALILDLDLPDGDGMEWLTDLRANHPALPILVVSGSARKDAAECITRGADCFFSKPVSMQRLHHSLIHLLNK